MTVTRGPLPAATAAGPGAHRDRALARFAPAVGAMAVMASVGSIGLPRADAMGNDEVVTRWAAGLPLGRLRHLLGHVDAVHGAYYGLMHVWTSVGDSPAVLRVPSVLAMTAAVGVVVLIARRLTGSPAVAAGTGIVVALTPSIAFYAQTARSYALVYLAVAVATLALLRVLDPGGARPRRLAAYGAAVVVAGYLNELSLLVLLAHAVTVLATRAGLRLYLAWAGTSAAAVLLVSPLILFSRTEAGVLGGLQPPGVRDLRVLWHDYVGVTTPVAVLLSACAVLAVGVAVRSRTARPANGARPPGAVSVGLPLALLPAGALLAFSRLVKPVYFDRYVLFGELGAALLVGAGLQAVTRSVRGRTGSSLLAAVPAAVVLAGALVLQLPAQQRIRMPQSRLFDFGGPAHFVGAHAQPGDAVLFLDTFYRKARLGYPEQFARTTDLALAVSPEITGDFRGRDEPVPVVRARMLQQRRIWVVGVPPTVAAAGSLPVPAAEAQLLLQRFVPVQQRRWGGITVSLWRRR